MKGSPRQIKVPDLLKQKYRQVFAQKQEKQKGFLIYKRKQVLLTSTKKGFEKLNFFFPGQNVVREIQRTVAGADLELMLLNLDSLDNVREFATKLHSTVDKVHIAQ